MARPSGGLITIFRIKLSKFSETVLQFDNFHIKNIYLMRKYGDVTTSHIKSSRFSEIVSQFVCPLINLNRISGTIS